MHLEEPFIKSKYMKLLGQMRRLIEETKKTAYRRCGRFSAKNDGTGANYYRIPALLTLKSGALVGAVDARFGGTHDSPNNIDIAVSEK
ncbi:MAG: hypothetical protein ACLTKE_12240 [Coprococcus sp.]